MSFFRKYYPGLILFVISLVIGLVVYKDYGISWDEPAQQGLGKVTYAYVTTGDKYIKVYDDRALGTSFELPLIYLEHWLHPKEEHSVYEMRHLVTHIFFLIGVLCGYILALKLFRSQLVACLGFIMLAFNPRIYAHSFFNCKDIPFLSAFLISMLICKVAFDKNRTWWYLLLGFAVGYAVGIRAIGIVLIPCVSLFFLTDLIKGWQEKKNRWLIPLNFVVFFAGFCGMLYASWPFLWGDPIFYFKDAVHRLAVIDWDGTVLFNGKIYKGMELPYSYLPVWFVITTPIMWLITGAIGVALIIWGFVKRPIARLADGYDRHFLMYLACFFLPPLATAINHSAIIDDWRHLYFIYPCFVMICLYGVNSLLATKVKTAVLALCGLQFGIAGFFMIKYHPHQQVYFNELVSHDTEYLRKHYDLEYWGVAYKQGIQYILEHDNSPVINIKYGPAPIHNAIISLTDEQRKRLNTTDEQHADYFITNFRLHADDYNYPSVFYEIVVQKSTIMRVYKLH